MANNIIEFKKATYAERKDGPGETKYALAFERMERVKQDLQRTIDILNDENGKNLITCMGPLYYVGNTRPEITGFVSDYIKDFLSKTLARLDSEEFQSTFMLSDFPQLMELAESTFKMGIPTNVVIPFVDSVVTMIVTRIGTEWIITNVFRNHENLYQHAFEMAFANLDIDIEKAFTTSEDEE